MKAKAIKTIEITKEYCRDNFLPIDLPRSVVDIADDVTLRDIFMLIQSANKMMPNLSSAMGMSKFQTFVKTINMPKDEDFVDFIDFLELAWYFVDGPENLASMQNLMLLFGINSHCPASLFDEEHVCTPECYKETRIAVEFTSINNIADIPIRINPRFNAEDPREEPSDNPAKLTMYPTLYCFLSSILTELTIAGSTPDEIQQNRQILVDILLDENNKGEE